jgi:hypothetical protein
MNVVNQIIVERQKEDLNEKQEKTIQSSFAI